MGKATSVRFSDNLERYIADNKIAEHPGGISSWLNEMLEAVINGELIRPEELDTKDLDDLKKEKLKVEIEIAQGKKVIAQAHALDLESKRLDNEYKALRNEKMRRSLDGQPPTKPAMVTTKTTALLEFTIKCTECGKDWDSLYFEDRDNPLLDMHHVIASHLNIAHGIGTVPPGMSPYRRQEQLKQEMQAP